MGIVQGGDDYLLYGMNPILLLANIGALSHTPRFVQPNSRSLRARVRHLWNPLSKKLDGHLHPYSHIQ